MKEPIIKLIVAYANDNVIGKDGRIPWFIPEDLKRFKELTLHHTVIMGRKTYESIPNAPLKNRLNIVLTRDKSYQINEENVIVFNDASDVISFINTHAENQTVYVIGGQSLYEHFLPLCDEILATEVHLEVKGDAFFPKLSDRVWKQASIEQHINSNPRFDYVSYKRF